MNTAALSGLCQSFGDRPAGWRVVDDVDRRIDFPEHRREQACRPNRAPRPRAVTEYMRAVFGDHTIAHIYADWPGSLAMSRS